MHLKTTGYVACTFCFLLISACQTTPSANHQSKDASLYIGGTATATETADLTGLIDETIQTIDSVEFETNLLKSGDSYSDIYLRYNSGGGVIFADAPMLYSMISGQEGFHRVETPVALVKTSSDYDAIAGDIGDGQSGSFSLGRGHIRNWNEDRIVHQSCAVNTVAHEISHLISSKAQTFNLSTAVIQDRGAATHTDENAIASYLVGTVAQCTWLERKGHIGSKDISMCIEVFGHRGFNSGRCGQFSNDEKVVIKDGLYAPHVIVPD